MPLSRGSPTQRRGASHEERASAFLAEQGLQIVARNFNCKLGELDIIAQSSVLHFVEVRYRRNDRFGSAAESVTQAKRRKLRRTAALFLQIHPTFKNLRAQFDVITITGTHYPPRVEWIQDAF